MAPPGAKVSVVPLQPGERRSCRGFRVPGGHSYGSRPAPLRIQEADGAREVASVLRVTTEPPPWQTYSPMSSFTTSTRISVLRGFFSMTVVTRQIRCGELQSAQKPVVAQGVSRLSLFVLAGDA